MGKQFDGYNLKKNRVLELLHECSEQVTSDKVNKKIKEEQEKSYKYLDKITNKGE